MYKLKKELIIKIPYKTLTILAGIITVCLIFFLQDFLIRNYIMYLENLYYDTMIWGFAIMNSIIFVLFIIVLSVIKK